MLLLQPSRTRHGTRAGAPVLVALCLVPVALWIVAKPLDDRFAGSYTTLSSVAVLLASVGTTAFGLNLVLGARLPLVDRLFGGLDRMYAIHRRTGEAAFALLAGHVVLVVASRWTISPDSAVALLGPGAGWTVFAGVLAFAGMTVSLLLTLFARLGHEVFVYVQRSFGIVFALGAYHALTTDSPHGSAVLTAYLAAVSTAGLAAFGYRSLFGASLVRRRRYRVVAVNRLDEHVTEIVMRPVGRALGHAAGQFVFVNFRSLEMAAQQHPIELSVERQVLSIRPGEIRNQFHPFSITSAPGAPDLRITVKALGDYTSALRRLEPGAEALVEGPFGSFSHESLSARQVWAAGGIGVTPFLSMARSLGTGPEPAVSFYYCVESEDEAHFVDELEAIARTRENFALTVVPRNRDGFLTGARIAVEQRDLASLDVLVCGPPGMIDSLRTQLATEGLPADRFHAEEFSFAKLGASTPAPFPQDDRPRSDRSPKRGSDGRLIAALGAVAVAAVAFALGVAVGGSIASTEDDPSAPAPSTVPARGSVAAGRTVFAAADCGDCHTLEAAGANGTVGPDLDEVTPDETSVRDVVAGGRGVMPSYRDRLTSQQIADVAAFVAARAGR